MDKVGVIPKSIDSANDDCESDFAGENTEQRMDEYLKHRKQCLLKYCGDVCKTRQESGGGKYLGVEDEQVIVGQTIIINCKVFFRLCIVVPLVLCTIFR
mgnify:CR=1 FL=1